jgi:large subunit ribosomal protein L10
MNRNEKEAAIESYKALFNGIESVVVADTSGVPVNVINEVRSKFRAEGVTFRVIKNTLAKKALIGTVLEPVTAKFHGPIAVAMKLDDPISPARVAVDFAKNNPSFKITAGFVSGQVLDAAGVDSLSKMRTRNEARSALLSVFKGSATKFAALIKARAEKMEKPEE